MKFAIIIPSKVASNLRACVRAVYAHEPEITPDRIIVVDDGAYNECAQAGGKEGDGFVHEVTWLKGIEPFVFARNCNIGIRAALERGAETVILLNDDALLQTAEGFTALADQVMTHPLYGVIGAVTNITGQPLQQPRKIGLREVPHIAFICVCIPRRTIDRIGSLDERYCLDYGVEDRDYCEACRRAGLKVGVYDFCFVDHASLHSTFRGDPQRPLSFQRNRQLFMAKWKVPCY
jgi:GT2 family glycosyltransferase